MIERLRTPVGVWIGVLAITAGGVGLIAVADRPLQTGPRTTAETLLPPNGSVNLLEYDDGSQWILESAHTTGVLFLVQQPPGSGNHQLQRMSEAGVDPTQSRFWRLNWTDVSGEREQITELYELDTDGVRMLALTGGPNGFTYDPGLLVLPSDIADGSTWSSSGDALPGELLQYTSTGSARATEGGCFEIETTLEYFDPAQEGASVFDNTETDEWCPGRGIVDAQFVSNEQTGGARTSPLENGWMTAPDSAPRVVDFADHPAWNVRELALGDEDPVFGDSTLLTTTDSTAATTPSGIAVFNTGVDTVAYQLEGDEAERVWIARAGGSILWLSTIGETVLVATTERRLVAYASDGQRLWAVEFADVLGAPPAPDGDGGAIVQVLNGDLVRIDLADGSETWRTRVSDDADVTPLVHDGHVYAADRAGGLYSFALESGDEEWTGTAVNPAVLAAVDGRVFVASRDGAVEAWDTEWRVQVWSKTIPGIPDALVATATRVIVQSDETTVAYDLQGNRQWTTAAGDGLATDGERILVVGQGAAVLVDDEANQLDSWEVDEPTLAFTRRLVLGPTGFWIVGSDFRVQVVGSP